MVIQRKCKLCGEPFDTTDRKELYCSDYCRNAALEKYHHYKQGRKYSIPVSERRK